MGELNRLIEVVGDKHEALAAYSLPWLIHLAGDVHNPLHTVSRYSKALLKGDRGGNDVWVRSSSAASINLHAFWDGIGGNDPSPAYVDRFAAELTRDYVTKHPNTVAETRPETWVVEGFYDARYCARAHRRGWSAPGRRTQRPIALGSLT